MPAGLQLGLTVLHSSPRTPSQVPANPVAGAILNLSIFQPPGAAHSIGFKPIFKVADPLTASGHFSDSLPLHGLYCPARRRRDRRAALSAGHGCGRAPAPLTSGRLASGSQHHAHGRQRVPLEHMAEVGPPMPAVRTSTSTSR